MPRIIHRSFATCLVAAGLLLTMAAAFAQPVRVVVALIGEPDSLDAHHITLAPTQPVFPNIYDKLVEFDENMNLVPQLATEWSVSEDGRTWTFKLREGHRFHDGTLVDAEAVKWSFDRFFDPEFAAPHRAWLFMIESVSVVDEWTVAFHTAEPYLFVPQRLTTPPTSIVSRAAVESMSREEFGQNPVGSGPFIFREWVRGSHLVLEKNPDHWLADQTNIDLLEFRFVPDASARIVGLETGELHFATHLPPIEANRLGENALLSVYNEPALRVMAVQANLLREPLSDDRVRQAIAHAIDRDLLVEAFLAGFAQVADSALPLGVWGYEAQDQPVYDPQRARELLAEAGYPDGIDVTFGIPSGTFLQGEQIGEAVAGMLNEVGIRTTVEIIESGRFFSLLRVPPEEASHELTLYGFGATAGEPDWILGLPYHSRNFAPNGSNRNFYSNPEIDRLLDLGPRTVGEAERRAIYAQIQEILWVDQPWIYLYFVRQIAVGTEPLEGVAIVGTETIHFRNARWNP